jgi:hypothetical protein
MMYGNHENNHRYFRLGQTTIRPFFMPEINHRRTGMKTKDFGLSCLLASNRCELISHELDDRGQVWMEFKDTELTRQLESQFFSGTVQVNLANYLSSQKQLKTLIFNLRRRVYGDGEAELSRRSAW